MKVVDQYIPDVDPTPASSTPDNHHHHHPQWNGTPHSVDHLGYKITERVDGKGGSTPDGTSNGGNDHASLPVPSGTPCNGVIRRGSRLKPSIFDEDMKRWAIDGDNDGDAAADDDDDDDDDDEGDANFSYDDACFDYWWYSIK